MATITAYVTKHAIRTGMIYTVEAEELGTTGKIRVVSGDLKNHEYQPGEWDSLEFLAYERMRKRLVNEIERVEKDLERLRKLDFSYSGPAEPSEEPEK